MKETGRSPQTDVKVICLLCVFLRGQNGPAVDVRKQQIHSPLPLISQTAHLDTTVYDLTRTNQQPTLFLIPLHTHTDTHRQNVCMCFCMLAVLHCSNVC